jgi:hypothetical protein
MSGSVGADHRGCIRTELVTQALHPRQVGRPAAVQQFRYLLTRQASGPQPGPAKLARNQVAPRVQSSRD